MQLLLINNAYNLEKKEIEDKIFFTLQDVLEKVYRDKNSNLTVTDQVKKESDNYYIVNVNDKFSLIATEIVAVTFQVMVKKSPSNVKLASLKTMIIPIILHFISQN